MIQACNSGLFSQETPDCRFVIRVCQRIDVRQDVVLPVDVDHFVEQLIELIRRQ